MLLVAIALVLRVVVYLADVAVDYYYPNLANRFNLDWANSFIYNITIVEIYVGVTAVAYIGSGFSYVIDPMPKQDPGLELAPFASPHVYE